VDQYWAVLYFYEEPSVAVLKNKLILSQFQFHTLMELGLWFQVQFFNPDCQLATHSSHPNLNSSSGSTPNYNWELVWFFKKQNQAPIPVPIPTQFQFSSY
jgi:hypothetical protein